MSWQSVWFDLHRCMKSMPVRFRKLKDNDLMDDADFNAAMNTVQHGNFEPSDTTYLAKHFMGILVRLKPKTPTSTNRNLWLPHLRTFRSWVARVVIFNHQLNDTPAAQFVAELEKMDELSEIVIEWKYLGIETSRLVEEIELFLDFEDAVLNALIDGEGPVQKASESYAKFTEKATFVSGFILIRNMVELFGLNPIQRQVTEDLSRFESNIMLYHISARWSVNEYLKQTFEQEDRKDFMKTKIFKVMSQYGDGIRKTQSKDLWRLYMETVDRLYAATEQGVPSKHIKTLWIRAKIAALDAKKLNTQETEALLDKLAYKDTLYASVITSAVKQNPRSCEFWCRLLSFHIYHFTHCMDTLLINFNCAIEKMLIDRNIDDLFRIFNVFIGFLMVVHPLFCENIFFFGMGLDDQLASLLLIPFLNWSLLYSGLENTRAILEEDYISAASLEFFKLFLSAELNAPQPDAAAIRNCFQVAVRFYGHEEESLWEDYLNFELSKYGNAELVLTVYNQAKAQYTRFDRGQLLFNFHQNSRKFRMYVQKL